MFCPLSTDMEVTVNTSPGVLSLDLSINNQVVRVFNPASTSSTLYLKVGSVTKAVVYIPANSLEMLRIPADVTDIQVYVTGSGTVHVSTGQDL